MRVGLISDTHGLLRPEAVQALAGVEQIIHAGDVGTAEVIEHLQGIAPVHAVRGNNDTGPWAAALPSQLKLSWEGVGIRVLHDVKELEADPAAAGCQAVISGHSHKPGIIERGGVLFVNPGSAGPKRFKLPITVGYLILAEGSVRGEIRNIA
jgi:uncharacterized protein